MREVGDQTGAASLRPEAADLPSISRRLGKNVAILLGGSTAASVVAFGALALNARALGPEGLGTIVIVQAFASVLTGIFAFGTQQPLIRFGAIAMERGDSERLANLTAVALAFDVAAAATAGIVGLLLVSFAGDFVGLKPEHRVLATYYVLSVFFSGVGASNGILRLLNKIGWLGFIQLAGAIASLSVSALFYIVAAPVLWYVIAFALISALTMQVQVWLSIVMLAKRAVRLRLNISRQQRNELFQEFAKYSWTTSATGTIDILRSNGDVLLLGALVGPAGVGVYNVAKQVAGILGKLSTAAGIATYPEVAALAAKRDIGGARAVLLRLVGIGGAIALVGLAGIAILGGPFLRIALGPAFVVAYWPMLIMTLVAGVQLVSFSFGGFVQSFRGPIALLGVYVVSFVLYCVTAPLAIASMGSVGAAISQLAFGLASGAGCAWVLWNALRAKGVAAYPQQSGRAP